MRIISRLKEAMYENEIGSKIAAQTIGCSQRQVQRWIRGDAHPTRVYEQLIELAIKKMPSL